MRNILLLALLAAPAGADEHPPKLLLRVDPPTAAVRVCSATTSRPVGPQPIELPQDWQQIDPILLHFSDPDYYELEVAVPKTKFASGQTLVLPPDGQPAYQLPARTPLAHLRRNALPLGLLSVGLLGFGSWHGWKRHQRVSLQRRLLRLGGTGEEASVGPYVLLRLLGEGGYGEVFLAVHKAQFWDRDPPLVALKRMSRANLDATFESGVRSKVIRETLRERFRREAQALEKLNHPNIVRPVHFDLDGPKPYLAMELVQGQTLEKRLKQFPEGMAPEEAMKILEPVCQALQHVHSQDPPILHRDLKPANIMLDEDGTVKVMDFGLAYSIGDQALTASAEWVGTPAYASPDSFMKMLAPAMDQYAIGLIAFELLTGRTANQERDDPLRAVHVALSDDIQRLSKVRPDLGDFARAVDRMYALSPEARFPSMQEALATLRAEAARLRGA